MDDAVFTDGEADIDLVPIGAVDGWPEGDFAADDALVGTGIGGKLAGFGHAPETPDQNLRAAHLVDEIDRASGEGLPFVGDQGVARQENHRQGDAALAQLG
jgi:hypothetical protein